MTPPTIIPAKPRVRRKRKAVESPPAALNLIAAEFDEKPRVVLTFDRPIDIAAFNGSAVTVDDGAITGTLWQGLSALLTAPASVEIELEPYDPAQSAGTVLSAGANNGIVALDDGGTWAGVTDVELPFP